jgi:amino acid transporter
MSQLLRELSLSDVVFSGFGYTVGADIFALLPYIVKNGKNYTWVAFLISGFLVLATALSYARLNIDYPSNDAEYTWIRESFKVKDEDIKDEKDKVRNKVVDVSATVIIWAVMILGITMNAVMVLSINRFIKNTNINLSDGILNLLITAVPFVFNLLDVKNMSKANIIVTILTSLILFSIPGLATTNSAHIADITPNKVTGDTIRGVIKAIGITILPYNGYQSVVQMSEEVKDVNDVPKGMIISGILAIALYTVLSLSVVAILGISKTTSTATPIADIFSKFFGKSGGNIANTVGILTGFTTLLLSFYSRSRLLSKISEYGIAPEVFSNLGLNNNNKEYFKGIPFNSIVVISIFSYLCTLFKKDSLEFFTDLTNLLTCFVFIFVNLAVIYNYYKNKKSQTENAKPDKDKTFIDKFKETVPFYSVIGIITFSILLFNSIRDFF